METISTNRGMPAKALLWGTLFLVVALAFTAWFLYEKKERPPFPESFEKLRVERPSKAILAPDFTLEDLSGNKVSLKNFRGKTVFLNFWATWCVPCRAEMPAMERLHRELKDQGLEVVAVNFREDEAEVRDFLKELGLTFTVLLDRDGEISEEYGVWSLPLSYFINSKGEFVGKALGARDWGSEAARSFFHELLQEKS